MLRKKVVGLKKSTDAFEHFLFGNVVFILTIENSVVKKKKSNLGKNDV